MNRSQSILFNEKGTMCLFFFIRLYDNLLFVYFHVNNLEERFIDNCIGTSNKISIFSRIVLQGKKFLFYLKLGGDDMAIKRLDRDGSHRKQFENNKKKIYATQSICGICGKPVDFSYKYPHPLSPCIDHIIPVAKGGHPSDIDNLQLAHWTCNRQKSDKLFANRYETKQKIVTNRDLPQTINWKQYKSSK